MWNRKILSMVGLALTVMSCGSDSNKNSDSGNGGGGAAANSGTGGQITAGFGGTEMEF
jgi:hypothetical protein